MHNVCGLIPGDVFKARKRVCCRFVVFNPRKIKQYDYYVNLADKLLNGNEFQNNRSEPNHGGERGRQNGGKSAQFQGGRSTIFGL